jgi:hypothetical protein
VEDATDPTEDITELCAVIRSNEMELDLIDKWLSGLDQPPDKMEITQKLLELRSLCLLRSRLLLKIESNIEDVSISGAA